MTPLISAVILFVVACNFNYTTGYKWETVKQGSKLPNNTVRLGDSTYVGRVVHFNLILPAKVFNSSYAVAVNPNTKTNIYTKQFEVLTASEKCEWKPFGFSNVPDNIVRVGRAWNLEPIYLGSVDAVGYNRTNKTDVASILLTSKKFSASPFLDQYALVCDDNATWVDATPPAVLRNAIVIKKNYFVARLVGPLSFIPAYIRNDSYFCSTVFDKTQINSLTCQVLVESNSHKYSWKSPGIFERIPEYAIAIGRTEQGELIYVIRDAFSSFGVITFSEATSVKYTYDVLVKNIV